MRLTEASTLFRRLPRELRPQVRRAGDVAAEMKLPAFLVGGFVRDLILGRRNFDLDIAVEGPAIGFAKRFAAAGVRCRLVSHARFGTATVECPGPRGVLKIDFATTRRESYPVPGALPVVSPSTIRDDLYRRDFTINTLAVGIWGNERGRLIDPFGGRKDLAQGLIRVLHDASFIDDPTRILRAVRFEQRFGFRIEPRTLRLLKESAGRGMLCRVQPQRLRDELLLSMNEEFPEKVLDRLQVLAGLGFISPRIVSRRWAPLFARVRKEAVWAGKSFSCQFSLPAAFLTALLSDLAPCDALRVCDSFGIGKYNRSAILAYAASGGKVEALLSRRGVGRPALFRALAPLPPEAVLVVSARTQRAAVRRRVREFLADRRGARVCISGEDLKRLGIPPGPEYGRLLRAVLDARLSGRITTKDDELELVSSLMKGNTR